MRLCATDAEVLARIPKVPLAGYILECRASHDVWEPAQTLAGQQSQEPESFRLGRHSDMREIPRSLKHLPLSLGNPIFVAAREDCCVSRPGL